MAWHEDPRWLRFFVAVLLTVVVGLVGLRFADSEPADSEPDVTPNPAPAVEVASEACERAIAAANKVSTAAGTALYVAPDVAPLVRNALAARDDRAEVDNVLEHLGALTDALRSARSFSESGDPPAWWRFQKWSALCLGKPVAEERYEPPAGNRDDVREIVRRFMRARMRGSRAERFLAREGRDDFGRPRVLAPLYPNPPLEGFDIVFVDDLGDGSYEVGVELVLTRERRGETLFVLFDGRRYAIHGGRPGLEGP